MGEPGEQEVGTRVKEREGERKGPGEDLDSSAHVSQGTHFPHPGESESESKEGEVKARKRLSRVQAW